MQRCELSIMCAKYVTFIQAIQKRSGQTQQKILLRTLPWGNFQPGCNIHEKRKVQGSNIRNEWRCVNNGVWLSKSHFTQEYSECFQ